MSKHSRRSPLSSLLLIISILAVTMFPATRSAENDPLLRFPSDGGDNSICSAPVAPGACPVKCFRTDPVCGVDNVTYWCGCADALCAGTRVAKLGFCEVESGGSGPVSGQALQLVQIVWLILLGIFVLFGLL